MTLSPRDQLLADELTNDPEGIGWSAMSDKEVAEEGNTENRPFPFTTLTGAEIYECTNQAEFDTKVSEHPRIDRITGLGGETVEVGPGSRARSEFIDIFGPTSATISNLQGKLANNISRFTEIKYGHAKQGDIARVRA